MGVDGTTSVALPIGLWSDGQRYRDARIHPFRGRDEAALLDSGVPRRGAAWTTVVLHRCLDALGPMSSVDPEAVRSLTVGDREALLLHLRRLTLGNTLPCVLTCPSCGQKMDLELSARELLLSPQPLEQKEHEMTVEYGEKTYRVEFRLPTGADQEAVAPRGVRDPKAAVRQIVRRCVERVVEEGRGEVGEDGWPDVLVNELSDEMETLDPQAELRINVQCPECEHAFSFLFDTATYFSEELRHRGTQLYREVHTLAFYYHWSETEIMNLTLQQRSRYIELINDALSEGRRPA